MRVVSARRAAGGSVVVIVAGLLVALALAFFVSPHASSSPDGLEKVAAQRALDTDTRPHTMAGGPLADYAVRGVDDPALSTGLAGVVGVAATFLIATGAFALVRRIRPRHRATGRATAPATGPVT